MHQGQTMEGSRVWALMLITHQKGVATHTANILSKQLSVEESKEALEDIKLK